jgi:stage III sporulation protein AG
VDFKKLLEELKKFKSITNIYNIVVLFLVGVLIVLVSTFFKENSTGVAVNTMVSKDQEEVITQQELKDYEQAQNNKLKYMLGQMKGVGRVEVMIHLEDEGELVPAVNINNGSSSINEKDNEGGVRSTTQNNNGSTVVITNKGSNSEPLILKKYYPKITGVMVVAEGAQDKQIQFDIVKVVSQTFNIPTNKVNVYPMK